MSKYINNKCLSVNPPLYMDFAIPGYLSVPVFICPCESSIQISESGQSPCSCFEYTDFISGETLDNFVKYNCIMLEESINAISKTKHDRDRKKTFFYFGLCLLEVKETNINGGFEGRVHRNNSFSTHRM